MTQTQESVSQTADDSGATPALGAPDVSGAPVSKPLAFSERTLFVHHDAHPVALDAFLVRKYGVEWFSWEAPTLWREIIADLHIPSISDHAKAKIQAIKTLHVHDSFWTNWEVFSWITQALNNNIPDWQTLQKPSIGQMLVAVHIAQEVRTDCTFTDDVTGFVAASFLDDDVLFAPDVLSFAQDSIRKYAIESGIDSVKYIVEGVQEKFQLVRNLTDAGIRALPTSVLFEENVVDIQAAKLKVAWDYLTMRKAQLDQQLGALL